MDRLKSEKYTTCLNVIGSGSARDNLLQIFFLQVVNTMKSSLQLRKEFKRYVMLSIP